MEYGPKNVENLKR